MWSGGDNFRTVLLGGIVLCGAAIVSAQDIMVSRTSYDFGNVVVGDGETVTWDIWSGPPTAAWVFTTYLNYTPDTNPPAITPLHGTWSLGPFSFNPATYPVIPLEMPAGTHIYVDITFKPTAPGSYFAYFGLESNDSIDGPGPRVFFPLSGVGVSAVPAPGAALLVLMGLASCTGLRIRRRIGCGQREGES